MHLLLGNHDFHYFDDEYVKHIYLCRYCTHFAKKIKSLFRDNKDVFSLAWDCLINDTLVLFTHAGVLKGWVDMCFEGNTIKRPDADFMNNLLETGNVLPLAMISPDRGGRAFSVGSPIWADYQEHIYGWLLEQTPDRRKQIVYKDKIVYRDSIIIQKQEVPVEVEVVKKVVPCWCQWLLVINILAIIGFAIRLYFRFRLR